MVAFRLSSCSVKVRLFHLQSKHKRLGSDEGPRPHLPDALWRCCLLPGQTQVSARWAGCCLNADASQKTWLLLKSELERVPVGRRPLTGVPLSFAGFQPLPLRLSSSYACQGRPPPAPSLLPCLGAPPTRAAALAGRAAGAARRRRRRGAAPAAADAAPAQACSSRGAVQPAGAEAEGPLADPAERGAVAAGPAGQLARQPRPQGLPSPGQPRPQRAPRHAGGRRSCQGAAERQPPGQHLQGAHHPG